MPELTRREPTASWLRLSSMLFLPEPGFPSRAFADSIRPAMEAWLRRLDEPCGDLRSGEGLIGAPMPDPEVSLRRLRRAATLPVAQKLPSS